MLTSEEKVESNRESKGNAANKFSELKQGE